MKDFVLNLVDQFDARSLRERLLIGATLFAVTWGLWIATIGGPVIDKKADVVTSIDRLAQDLRSQTADRARIRQQDTAPVVNALEAKQAKLRELIISQQEDLDALLLRFVPPDKVPMLLEDVLSDFADLKLLSLSVKPAEPIELKVQQGDEMSDQVTEEMVANAAMPIEIYRHPVQLEFEGSYLEVLKYLTALESGQWQFAWRKFEYAVNEYPKAKVLVELETLSREREWLGV